MGGGEGKNERRREEGEGVGWEERRGGMRVGGGVRRVKEEGWVTRERGGERRVRRGREGREEWFCYCEDEHVFLTSFFLLTPPFQPSDPPASPRSILKGGRIYEEERAVPLRYRQVSPQV